MKNYKYVQARLVRGDTVMVTWIERKPKVRKGVRVRLKEDLETADLWTVEEIWNDKELSEQYLKDHEADYRNQRKASDV